MTSLCNQSLHPAGGRLSEDSAQTPLIRESGDIAATANAGGVHTSGFPTNTRDQQLEFLIAEQALIGLHHPDPAARKAALERAEALKSQRTEQASLSDPTIALSEPAGSPPRAGEASHA